MKIDAIRGGYYPVEPYSPETANGAWGKAREPATEDTPYEDGARDSLFLSLADLPAAPPAEDAAYMKTAASKPKDESLKLTRQLVSSIGQFQVRQVMIEATKSLTGLYIFAATAKKEDADLARGYIAKIEKLIRRAQVKLRDLDKEDALGREKTRAEKAKQRHRADEIKAELRKRIRDRERKERRYLQEMEEEAVFQPNTEPPALPDLQAETAAAAEAEAIAAAEFHTVSAGGDAAGIEAAGMPADAGGGEAAPEAGGEAAAE